MKFVVLATVLLLAFASVQASECQLEASRNYLRSYCSVNEEMLAPFMDREQCQAHLSQTWEATLFDDKAASQIIASLPVNGSHVESDTVTSGKCGIKAGVQCAAKAASCLNACRGGLTKCAACFGSAFKKCCPCLSKFGIKLNC